MQTHAEQRPTSLAAPSSRRERMAPAGYLPEVFGYPLGSAFCGGGREVWLAQELAQ